MAVSASSTVCMQSCRLGARSMLYWLLTVTLIALTATLAEGFTPTFEPKLGTSRGGTRIKVRFRDQTWSLFKHFLHVGGNGTTVAADHVEAINDFTVESQFTMPNIPSGMGTKGVVELSFSHDGGPYVDIGDFVFYDGEQLESNALSIKQGGDLALERSVFPETFSPSLVSNQFTPLCGFQDGTVFPAKHSIPYEYARRSTAKLSIFCDQGATLISLNDQEYFAIPGRQARKEMEIQPQSMAVAHKSSEVHERRILTSGPVCTTTDTGMGLSILVTYMTPSYDPVNATTDTAGTFIGYGGPLAYLINIVITAPGSYQVTSMFPNCVGASPVGGFNVSGAPSPQYSAVSSTFNASGYNPGTPVSFTITSVDGLGVIASGQIQGPFPFLVNLNQLDSSTGNIYLVPFTVVSQPGGTWKVTCTPTRFLPVAGSVMLGSLLILNGNFNFTIKPLTQSQATATFSIQPNLTMPLPAGPTVFSIDSAENIPKYTLIHIISLKITDPGGVVLLQAVCGYERATIGCFFPITLTKAGTYIVRITIDAAGTALADNATLIVAPGMVSGPKSSFSLQGMSQNNLSQKTAGDTITANLTLQDSYGNLGNSSFYLAGWDVDVTIALMNDRGVVLTMNVNAGLGSTTGSAVVTSAGNYIVTAYIGSTGNTLIGSGKYIFNVKPFTANTSGFTGNMMVGKMVAGQPAAVQVALLDMFGNTIDGSVLNRTTPVVIHWNGQNLNVTNNGLTFELIPGLNQTVATSGITINATYMGTQVATFSGTCFPGPADVNFSNITSSAQNFSVGTNGTLQLTLKDSYGNLVDPTTNNFPFTGASLIRQMDAFGGQFLGACNLMYAPLNGIIVNPYLFTFTVPTIAAMYYAHIPVGRLILETPPLIQVVAGDPQGQMFTISGLTGIEPRPGTSYSVYITARDMYGNLWNGDGTLLNVAITGPGSRVVAAANKTISPDPVMGFVLTFTTPLAVGICTISAHGYNSDSTSTKVNLRITAGDFAQVAVEQVRQSVINQYATFFLVAQDAHGYPRDNPGIPPDRFNVKLCNNVTCGKVTINDKHLSGGRYKVTWSAPIAGNYGVFFFTPIGAPSPLSTLTAVAAPRTDKVMYYPRCSDAPPTLATCPQFYEVVAGEVSTFVLAAFNEPTGGPNSTINQGGNLPAVFMTGGSIISLTDQGDGTYTLSYMATSLTSSLTVTNGVPSNIPLQIVPGRTSPLKSTCQLQFTLQLTYIAGSTLTAVFNGMDSLGNAQNYNQYSYTNDKFALLGVKDNGEEVLAIVIFYPAGRGLYGAHLNLVWAGIYTLQATLNGYTIPLVGPNGNPLAASGFVVTPTTPEYNALSYLPPTLQLYTAVGASGSTAVYSLNDRFGNHIPRSMLNCSARILDVFGTPWDPQSCTQSDDHVTFSWSNIHTAGTDQFQGILQFGSFTMGLRNPMMITAGDPWPSACVILTPQPVTSSVGTKTILEFVCNDNYGNPCLGDRSGQFSVVVARLGGSPYDPPMYASTALATSIVQPGRYQAYFILMLIGNFTATLRLGDIRGVMIGSPLIIHSIPAATSVPLSFASLATSPRKLMTNKVAARFVAGSTTVIKVVGVDVNGNLQDHSMCNVTYAPNVTLTSDDPGFDGAGAGVAPLMLNPIVKMSTTDPGCAFWFNFTATAVARVGTNPPVSATYTMQIQWIGGATTTYSDIAGSPFTFQVDPAPLDIPSSVIQLSGRGAGPTGLITSFLLLTKDYYGNQPFYAQALSVAAIVAPAGTYTPHRRRLLEQSEPGTVDLDEVTNDADSGDMVVPMDVGNPSPLMTPTIVSNLDTTYTISFTVIKSGFYDLFVYMNGVLLQTIPGSMATIQSCVVGPGMPDISRIRPIGLGINDGNSLAVGSPMSLVIALCDNFGNPVDIHNSPDLLNKYMNGVSTMSNITLSRSNIANNTLSLTPITVNGTTFAIVAGQITFSCTPLTAGLMNIALAYSDNGGYSIVKSVLGPFHVSLVANGTAALSTFQVFGPGVTAAPACDDGVCPPNTMYVKVMDANQNLLFPDSALCQEFAITGWNSSLMVGLTGKPIYDNYCAISWKLLPGNLTQSVVFNVTYTSGGTSHGVPADPQVTTADLSGFKLTIPILPDVVDVDPDKCIAFGDLGGLMMAGTSGHIVVQLVDYGGIALQASPSTNGDFVSLSISSSIHSDFEPPPPNVNSIDNGDGTFSLQYDTARAGMFQIVILVGSLNRPLGGRSSGYNLQVVAAPSVIESTTVLMVSNGLVYRAGQDHVQIQVQALDMFLNLQDYVLSQADGFQADILQPDNTVAIVALDRRAGTADNGNPYVSWLLDFLPLQAGPGSTYTFTIVWRNDTVEIPVPSTAITVPTLPGQPSALNMKVTGPGVTAANVGQWATLSMQLYDSLKNPITEVQDIAAADISVALSLGKNFTSTQANCTVSIRPPAVVCRYMVTVSGWYILNIYSGTTNLKTLGVQVGAGVISAQNCIASGDGVGTTGLPLFPGIPTTFNIQAFDHQNNTSPQNKAFFEVKGENMNQMGVIVPKEGYPVHISGNSFQVQFTPLKAGLYNLFVRRASVDIQGSPYQIAVQVGPVAPNCILDDESLTPCQVLSFKNITLWSRDAYGNIRANQRDIFHIFTTIDGFPYLGMAETMTYLGGGAYGFSFPCWNDTLVQVVTGGVLVYQGKLITIVGPPDAGQTTLSLDDSFIAAGTYGHGTVVTRDIAGHQLISGQQSIFINYGTALGYENGSMVVTDRGDGTYDLSYMILTSGVYQLQGTLNEYWPFFDGTLLVVPSTPASAAIYFDPNGYTVGTAGIFQIQFFDEHLNNITNSGVLDTSSFTLFFMSWECPPRTATYTAANMGVAFNASNGFYIVTFNPTIPGNVFVNLRVAGNPVLNHGTPYSAQVDYLPPAPYQFDIWGAGIETGGITGENTYFYVRVRDTLGTVLPNEPGDVFDTHFTPDSLVPSGATSAFVGNGIVMFTYSPIENTTSLSVLVNYGGQQIQDPVTLTVVDYAGPIDFTQSVVLGPDNSEVTSAVPFVATVGTPDMGIPFTIQPRDSMGFVITTPNPNNTVPTFVVTVLGGGPPIIVQCEPGGWSFSFTLPLLTTSGYYFVSVQGKKNGTIVADVKNSGFTLYLAPGFSNATNARFVRGNVDPNSPTKVIAGQAIDVYVQAFDSYNNAQIYNLYALDYFTATLNLLPRGDVIGPIAAGVINGDLTYNLHLTTMAVGAYNFTVFLGSDRCFALQVIVVTSDLSLPSLLMVNSVDPMMVGVETSFLISASDVYQNPITDPGNIYCALQQTTTLMVYEALVLASNDTAGQFWVYYTPVKAGHYHINVGDGFGRNGATVRTLMDIDVWPGPVSVTLTTTSVLSQTFKAGSPATFNVVALDAMSNPNYTIPIVMISTLEGAYAAQVISPCTSAALTGVYGGDSSGCLPTSPNYTAQISFIPLAYGQVNITIQWDQDTSMTYYSVPIQAGTRPIALGAKMSKNLGSISVYFDTPTDAGYAAFSNLTGLHLGWQRCNSTLDPSIMGKIGINPNCAFTDANTMTIQLGFNATINSMDSGTGDNISISTGIYNQLDTSVSVNGWIPIGITDFSPPPVAKLVGASITGVCDNLTLDASGSTGAAGRPMTYRFSVKGTGNPGKLANLGQILNSMSSQMIVTVYAGQLDPDQSYIFQVTVMNYLGMSSMATLTVQTVKASVPQVSIRDNEKVLEVMRWNTIELEARAHLANIDSYQSDGSCGQVGSKLKVKKLKPPVQVPLMYEWTQTGSSLLDQDAVGWNARSLTIPGNMVRPGLLYSFQVKVWPQGSPQLSSTASISIHATPSPLVVKIIGGDRVVNATEDLYVEAAVYDPDDSVESSLDQPHPFEITWSCDHIVLSDHFDAALYPDVTGAIKRVLLIKSSLLMDGMTYVFNVTVARAPYTDKSRTAATTSASITASNTAMTVLATVNDEAEVLAYGISSARMLKVMCSPGFGNYHFTVYSPADQRTRAEMQIKRLDEHTIRVDPLTLMAGATYTFTCLATSPVASGMAQVTVTTIPDPSGGTVELKADPPNSNTASTTAYSLRAYGWTPGGDMMGLLKYEFRYVVMDMKGRPFKEVIIHHPSTLNKVNQVYVLPGMIVFRVYIINPGPIRFMPNDAPHGAVFEFAPILVRKSHQRRLLALPPMVTNYYDLAKKGIYYRALVAIDAYSSTTFPNPAGGCGGGGNKKVIKDMLKTIEFNDPQYPAASQGNAVQSGSGPYIALLTASIYSKLIERPGNLNFDDFKAALHIFLQKLDKVAAYGIKVPTLIDNPYDAFLDAGDAFVKAVRMKCFKSSTQAQAMMDRVSIIPVWLAEMLYRDTGFVSPALVERPMFTVGALNFKLPDHPYNPYGGPVYLTGQLGNFFATVKINKGGGAEFGIASGCFNKFSPLSAPGTASLNRDKKFLKLIAVCDFLIVGLTTNDFLAITITGSWTGLPNLGKGVAYKAVQIDKTGTANTSILQNIVPTVTGVSFNFAGSYARVALIKVKADKNFSPVGWHGIHEKYKPPKKPKKMKDKKQPTLIQRILGDKGGTRDTRKRIGTLSLVFSAFAFSILHLC